MQLKQPVVLVVMEEILTLLQLMEQALVVVLEVLVEVTEKMLEEAEVPSVVEAAVLALFATTRLAGRSTLGHG